MIGSRRSHYPTADDNNVIALLVHLVVLPVEVKLLSSLAITVSSKGQSTVCPASDSFDALLRIVPRTGAIVTEIEFHKMRHVFQIRAELEDLAGRLAAENINHTQLNDIEKLVQACKKLAKMMNIKESIRPSQKKMSQKPATCDESGWDFTWTESSLNFD